MEITLIKREGSAMGGILMIAGCSVGAGMLGLPVVSALSGFIPSAFALLVVSLFMMTTALLILEVTLSSQGEMNFLSIAKNALGKKGEVLTWFLFLSIFYCLMVAYTSGGGELVSSLLTASVGRAVPPSVGMGMTVLFVGTFITFGTKAVDYLNRLLMLGLIAAYVALISIGVGELEPERLLFFDFTPVLAALPIFLVSFGFHNLIPSLTTYLKRDVKKLRLSIVMGSLIPLAIYLLWNGVILGLLQHPSLLKDAEMVTGLLRGSSSSYYVLFFANLFAILALITSFLTNALTSVDFLKEGLKTERRFPLMVMVLVPPFVCSLFSPHLFLKALGYAGGFATVFLFGLLPAFAVWNLRYREGKNEFKIVRGGKITLTIVMVMALFFLGLEICRQMGASC